MLEALFVLIIVITISVVDNLTYSVWALIILIILILPGFYAMISGAPYVPSLKKKIEIMLNLAKLSKSDRVVELGCGDGRIIRKIASERVREAVGYEFSLPTYLAAKILVFLKHSKARIKFANFWRVDLSRFDLIVCFLMEEAMSKFEKEVWPGLKKGTRLVSNQFRMKGVKPVECIDNVYLYIKKD